MKNRNIKERQVQRREFIYLHRVELLVLAYQRNIRDRRIGFSIRLTDQEKKYVDLLRKEMPYSIRTNDYDIFHSMTQQLKKLLSSHGKAN